MIGFTVTASLPAPAIPADVAKRTVAVSVNGTRQPDTDLAPDAASLVIGTFKVGDVLGGTLVDTDAAGNASPPRPFSFTVADTVAPPEPGEVNFAVEQVDVPATPPAA
jgi:hypothetical protein